jgi:hypothetical protein
MITIFAGEGEMYVSWVTGVYNFSATAPSLPPITLDTVVSYIDSLNV